MHVFISESAVHPKWSLIPSEVNQGPARALQHLSDARWEFKALRIIMERPPALKRLLPEVPQEHEGPLAQINLEFILCNVFGEKLI